MCDNIRLVALVFFDIALVASLPILSPHLFCRNSSTRVLAATHVSDNTKHAPAAIRTIAGLSCDANAFGPELTCCEEGDINFVLQHLEHTLDFLARHVQDRADFHSRYQAVSIGNHPCADAAHLMISSRITLLEHCHSLSEDVATLLTASVRHMLCSACVGGGNGVDATATMTKTEMALASEWSRVSQAIQKLYEELRKHDASVKAQLVASKSYSCIIEYAEAQRRGVFAPAAHTVTLRPWTSAGTGIQGFQEAWQRWIEGLLSISSEFSEGIVAETDGILLSFYNSQSPHSPAYPLIVQPPKESGVYSEIRRIPYAQHVNSFLSKVFVQAILRKPVLTLIVRMPNPGTNLRFDFASDPLTLSAQVLEQHINILQSLAAMKDQVRIVIVTANPEQASQLARAYANYMDVYVIWRRFALFNVDEVASLFASDHQSIDAPSYNAVYEMKPGGDLDELANAVKVLVDLVSSARDSHRHLGLMPSKWPHPLRPALPSSWSSLVAAASGTRLLSDTSSEGDCPQIVRTLKDYLQFHSAAVARLQSGSVERVLIYRCSAMGFCGGHGDRLNGLLGILMLAIASRRAFFIDAPRPVPMDLIFTPRKQSGKCGFDGQWMLDWRMHGAVAAVGRRVNYNDRFNDMVADMPWLLIEEPEPVVVLHSNQRITMPVLQSKEARALLGPGITDALIATPYLHADLLEVLFQGSPLLVGRHASMLKALRGNRRFLIAVHFRAGNRSPEKWSDPPRHQLSDLNNFLDCAITVEKRLGWRDEEVAWYVAADTSDVFKEARFMELYSRGKITILPEEQRNAAIIHLDRSPPPLAVQGLADTWAQWLTIASADAAVLSTSGFGVTAAEAGRLRHVYLGSNDCLPTDVTAS